MSISVVIVAKNAQDTIADAVRSLLEQTQKPTEILIVLDSPSDPTAEAVRGMPVRIILNRGSGLGAARQTGVESSEGGIIAFIDADCIADKSWLAELMKGFADPKVLVQAGSVVTVDSSSKPPYEDVRQVSRGRSNLKFAETMNFAFRKDLVNQIGNFDPSFRRGGEDLDFCIRTRKAGYTIHHNPTALVYHRMHGVGLRRFVRDGESRALAFVKHGSYTAGDVVVVALHMILLVCSLVLLVTGNILLAALVFSPSIGHRVYRALVSIRSGETIRRSVWISLAAYISYISFSVSLPGIALFRRSKKQKTSSS